MNLRLLPWNSTCSVTGMHVQKRCMMKRFQAEQAVPDCNDLIVVDAVHNCFVALHKLATPLVQTVCLLLLASLLFQLLLLLLPWQQCATAAVR